LKYFGRIRRKSIDTKKCKKNYVFGKEAKGNTHQKNIVSVLVLLDTRTEFNTIRMIPIDDLSMLLRFTDFDIAQSPASFVYYRHYPSDFKTSLQDHFKKQLERLTLTKRAI